MAVYIHRHASHGSSSTIVSLVESPHGRKSRKRKRNKKKIQTKQAFTGLSSPWSMPIPVGNQGPERQTSSLRGNLASL